MEADELDALIAEAKALAKARNVDATDKFGLGEYAAYELDLAASAITFLDEADKPALTARAVPIGSLAPEVGTWLWSWENASLPDDVTRKARAVEAFGAEHGIEALRRTFKPCNEELAWALAAIALKLLDAAAIYRLKQKNHLLFLLLFDLAKTP